jgi:hypothetical protein
VSHLKTCDFLREALKGLKYYNSLSETTTQLLSSGEFCKLRYDIITVKGASADVSSIPITKKCQILSCDTLVANERYIPIYIIYSCVYNKYINIHTYTFLECRVVLNIQQYGLVGDEVTGMESIKNCPDRANNPA